MRDTLIESHEKARLDIKTDLHFVVRSTGVVAELDSPDQVGVFIQALAKGASWRRAAKAHDPSHVHP